MCGSTAFMPRVAGWYSARAASGLSQITLWTDLARRAISSPSRSGSPQSHPSERMSAIGRPLAILRLQLLFQSASASPILVPPDQSVTAVETLDNATFGSRFWSSGVIRVKWVEKVNTSTCWILC